jgi:TonB family protein
VQAAVICPAAARMMHVSGKVGVTFDYRDGALVGEVQIARSSGTWMLDSAAAGAVREARYPDAPQDDARQVLHLLVWVDEACDR